jgi:hypothetical protein
MSYVYKIGKEFLLRNGITATVIDTDFGGHILLKYNTEGNWSTVKVRQDGREYRGNTDYDIVSEKPKLLKKTTYAFLYLMENDKLEIWGLYDIDDTDEADIDAIMNVIINNGYKFYGISKVCFESDGTKKKLNF